ncbi:PAP2-domain-containing protein [Saitoella complicata NRRL Y-17804]|nr:PAP2-domain-containing protein [Saitoella complicata NRRL Y-17804]ODQ56351.1 PAP2-domain-containing protein [Saitoella complicata NRRL Y-17804]
MLDKSSFSAMSFIPSIPSPSRLSQKFRARLAQTAPSELTGIETSFSPRVTIEKVKNHEYTIWDLQYVLLACLGVFSLCMIQKFGILFKLFVVTALGTALLIPITSQFFFPFLPIASWLVLFYACSFIPAAYRPHIWVRVLPALENIMYGANVSNILAKHTNSFLDVLSWIPYGVTHFGSPFVVSAVMFVFSPPGTLPAFAKAFGYMNLTGVLIQIFFPCSPPWYENLYGLAPANYGMPGSPGGLARIDALFGTATYTSTFTASPMVFGAFPSLHSGCATIEALFMSHVFPSATPFFMFYVMWLWWSTMYLTHHYFVDLIGGSCLAVVCFLISQRMFLPRTQEGKYLRWEYDHVVRGDTHASGISDGSAPWFAVAEHDLDLEMGELEDGEGDWALGSSSSASVTGSLSPVSESSGQTLGTPISWEQAEELERQRRPTPSNIDR